MTKMHASGENLKPLLKQIIFLILSLSLANYLIRLIPFAFFDYELTLNIGNEASQRRTNAEIEFGIVLFWQAFAAIALLLFAGLREYQKFRAYGLNAVDIDKRSYLLLLSVTLFTSLLVIAPHHSFLHYSSIPRIAHFPYPFRLLVLAITNATFLTLALLCAFTPGLAGVALSQARRRLLFMK